MAPPLPLLNRACLVVLLLLWASTDFTLSQNIVETLPGFHGKLPFKLETGYIGVGDLENQQIFYYFLQSQKDPKNDPLLLFLTGGPGCTGLHSLIYEIGPFELGNSLSNNSIPEVRLKPYSWMKVSNLLVIDQPVGAGFSYGKNSDAYKSSDSLAPEFTYQFLKKWLAVHPQYLQNPLYVGGDSYGGFYVPHVTQRVYDGNDVGDTRLNIKGYVLGNSLVDKFADFNGRIKYAHRMGLLSDSLYQIALENCEGNYLIVDPHNSLCQSAMQRLHECLDKICMPHILEHCCDAWGTRKNTHTLLLPSSSVKKASPYLSRTGGFCDDHNFEYSNIWANNKAVQEALHVREGTITKWVRCNSSMSYSDFGIDDTPAYAFDVKSVFAFHQNLTKRRARALIYSGDHDIAIPHTTTEEWISKLNLPVESGWRPWFVDGDIAGYTEKYSHLDFELTYATIKGAGHLASEQKPEEGFLMISRWLAEEPL